MKKSLTRSPSKLDKQSSFAAEFTEKIVSHINGEQSTIIDDLLTNIYQASSMPNVNDAIRKLHEDNNLYPHEHNYYLFIVNIYLCNSDHINNQDIFNLIADALNIIEPIRKKIKNKVTNDQHGNSHKSEKEILAKFFLIIEYLQQANISPHDNISHETTTIIFAFAIIALKLTANKHVYNSPDHKAFILSTISKAEHNEFLKAHPQYNNLQNIINRLKFCILVNSDEIFTLVTTMSRDFLSTQQKKSMDQNDTPSMLSNNNSYIDQVTAERSTSTPPEQSL